MDEFKTWSIKILLPSLVAVSMKLAVQLKKGLTWFSVVSSFATGVGCAYIFGPIISKTVPEPYQILAIAMVSISSEKIVMWLIDRFNIENFISAFVEKMIKK